MRYLLLFSLILSFSLFAQDERDYRSLFLGKLKREAEERPTPNYKWRVNTPFYYLDLTGDGLEESFGVEKRDGEDWIHFLDLLKRPFKSFKLDATGVQSYLYRIQMAQLSKTTKVIILYFFEGMNQTTEFRSSGRLYFITIDDSKLATLSMYKGPYILYEKQELPEHYHQRKFNVTLEDINKDGSKEIIVRYHLINRVFSYIGSGQWIGR